MALAGTAAPYGLDGPVVQSRTGGGGFPHLSWPPLGPTKPSVQRVRGHCRGGVAGALH